MYWRGGGRYPWRSFVISPAYVTRPWNGRLLSQAATTPASPRVSGEDRVPVVDKNVSPPARILIASAQTLVRAGLVAALARVHDLEVVGEVQYGKEVGEILELCRTLRPDLVLVDLDNGYRGGLEVVRE